jgi:hypothetical protein
VRVRFLDGPADLRQQVRAAASIWSRYANVTFDFGEDPNAEIRISFSETGNWSALGTDCLQIAPDRPTMNFGWASPDLPNEEIRGNVLRQFGHALGLLNAHSSPVANIPWDRGAVYLELTEPPASWSRSAVDAYLFDKYSPAAVQVGPPDPESIMHYPINPQWLSGPFPTIGRNTDLSGSDRDFIARLYPFSR